MNWKRQSYSVWASEDGRFSILAATSACYVTAVRPNGTPYPFYNLLIVHTLEDAKKQCEEHTVSLKLCTAFAWPA
jgi:hypothetical protein